MSVFKDTPWRSASVASAACSSVGNRTRTLTGSGTGAERSEVVLPRHFAFKIAVDASDAEERFCVVVYAERDANDYRLGAVGGADVEVDVVAGGERGCVGVGHARTVPWAVPACQGGQ